MREHKYILVNGQPIPEPDSIKWAMWFENSLKERIVEKTQIGGVEVSTVFLGLNHSFSETGLPILWETMVFGGPLDGEQERYTSIEAAKMGHAEMVERIKNEHGRNA